MILEGFQWMIVEIVPLDTTVKNLVSTIPLGFAPKATFVWGVLHHLLLVKGTAYVQAMYGYVQGLVQSVIFAQKEQRKVFISPLYISLKETQQDWKSTF